MRPRWSGSHLRRVILKQPREILALVSLVVVSIGVGAVILNKQRVTLPNWVPFFGEKYTDIEADMVSAQALTPGQGQNVNIAGIKVGEISKVRLEKGRAVVTFRIQQRYRDRIKRDASVLLRPRTGLKDMVAQLEPGRSISPRLREGERIPIGSTLPDVNVDEILASLDVDTRRYMQSLLRGGSEGLAGNSRNLSNTLRRSAPTAHHLATIGDRLAARRKNLSRVVHNLSLLMQELGEKDAQLVALIKNSNAVFEVLAAQDAHLRAAITELPSTLKATDEALIKAQRLSSELGPTLTKLRPSAQRFAEVQRDLRTLLRDTIAPIEKEIRPFVKAARPAANDLAPAIRDLGTLAPDLTKAGEVINRALNMLAYKPPGQEGFLFWMAWTNHLATSVLSLQDAHGPIRRGLVLGTCTNLEILNTVAASNPQLGTLVSLLNVPSVAQACEADAKTKVANNGKRAKR